MQSSTHTDDIDNQSLANYSYDLNGRLVSDVHDGVTEIKWSKSDKVLEVHKTKNTTTGIIDGVLTIKYNALDQKVSQSTSRNDSIVTEYFVYDPSGNVLATYGDTIFTTNGHHRFALHQLTIYGSSRVGLLDVDSLLWKDGSSNGVVSNVYTQKLGLKRYELSNHLGNVQTVVSDRKFIQGNGQNAYFVADVISVTDYYAFGMKITERSWNRLVSGAEPYRFGFNGKDFFSDWNRSDYGFRIYDDRKCRFESVDPLHGKYPELTTYQFAGNKPINCSDLDGLEENLRINSPWFTERIQESLQNKDWKTVNKLVNKALLTQFTDPWTRNKLGRNVATNSFTIADGLKPGQTKIVGSRWDEKGDIEYFDIGILSVSKIYETQTSSLEEIRQGFAELAANPYSISFTAPAMILGGFSTYWGFQGLKLALSAKSLYSVFGLTLGTLSTYNNAASTTTNLGKLAGFEPGDYTVGGLIGGKYTNDAINLGGGLVGGVNGWSQTGKNAIFEKELKDVVSAGNDFFQGLFSLPSISDRKTPTEKVEIKFTPSKNGTK